MYKILTQENVITFSTKSSFRSKEQTNMYWQDIQSNLVIRKVLIRNKLVLRNFFLWPIVNFLIKDKEHFALRNNFSVTKFDCSYLKQIFLKSPFVGLVSNAAIFGLHSIRPATLYLRTKLHSVCNDLPCTLIHFNRNLSGTIFKYCICAIITCPWLLTALEK